MTPSSGSKTHVRLISAGPKKCLFGCVPVDAQKQSHMRIVALSRKASGRRGLQRRSNEARGRITNVYNQGLGTGSQPFDFTPENWRRGWDLNPRVMVLQTIPLDHLGTAPLSLLCPNSMPKIMPNAPYFYLLSPILVSVTY